MGPAGRTAGRDRIRLTARIPQKHALGLDPGVGTGCDQNTRKQKTLTVADGNGRLRERVGGRLLRRLLRGARACRDLAPMRRPSRLLALLDGAAVGFGVDVLR